MLKGHSLDKLKKIRKEKYALDGMTDGLLGRWGRQKDFIQMCVNAEGQIR